MFNGLMRVHDTCQPTDVFVFNSVPTATLHLLSPWCRTLTIHQNVIDHEYRPRRNTYALIQDVANLTMSVVNSRDTTERNMVRVLATTQHIYESSSRQLHVTVWIQALHSVTSLCF